MLLNVQLSVDKKQVQVKLVKQQNAEPMVH